MVPKARISLPVRLLHHGGRCFVFGRADDGGVVDGGELNAVTLGAAARGRRLPSRAVLHLAAFPSAEGAASVADGGERDEAERVKREGERAHPAQRLQELDGGLARLLHALRLQHGDGAVRQLRDDRQQIKHAQRHHQAPVALHRRRPLRTEIPAPAPAPAPAVDPAAPRAVQGPVAHKPFREMVELKPLPRGGYVRGTRGAGGTARGGGGRLCLVLRHAADEGDDDEDGEDDEGDAGQVDGDDGRGHGRPLGDAVHAQTVARPDDGGEEPERHQHAEAQGPGKQEDGSAEGEAAAGAAVEVWGQGEEEAVHVKPGERQEGDEGQGAVQDHPGHAEAASQSPGLQVEVDAEGVHHHAERQVRQGHVYHLKRGS